MDIFWLCVEIFISMLLWHVQMDPIQGKLGVELVFQDRVGWVLAKYLYCTVRW